MKYPCLVPKRLCKIPAYVKIEPEGVKTSGEPFEPFEMDLLCNYQDGAKNVMTAEKKLVQVNGKALFPGDICPEVAVISGGTIKIFEVERRILQGTKARNPDGSVNFTEVLVI